MKLIIAPERIDFVISVDAETRKLIDRGLSLFEGTAQTQIDALAARLKDSRAKLVAAVTANPDPNPND